MPQKTTEMFWAFVYAITMATLLSVIGFVLPRPENTTQAMFRLRTLCDWRSRFFCGSRFGVREPDQGSNTASRETTSK